MKQSHLVERSNCSAELRGDEQIQQKGTRSEDWVVIGPKRVSGSRVWPNYSLTIDSVIFDSLLGLIRGTGIPFELGVFIFRLAKLKAARSSAEMPLLCSRSPFSSRLGNFGEKMALLAQWLLLIWLLE